MTRLASVSRIITHAGLRRVHRRRVLALLAAGRRARDRALAQLRIKGTVCRISRFQYVRHLILSIAAPLNVIQTTHRAHRLRLPPRMPVKQAGLALLRLLLAAQG